MSSLAGSTAHQQGSCCHHIVRHEHPTMILLDRILGELAGRNHLAGGSPTIPPTDQHINLAVRRDDDPSRPPHLHPTIHIQTRVACSHNNNLQCRNLNLCRPNAEGSHHRVSISSTGTITNTPNEFQSPLTRPSTDTSNPDTAPANASISMYSEITTDTRSSPAPASDHPHRT